MYAIYGNIYHQYTPNVSIYTIHGSYGLCDVMWLRLPEATKIPCGKISTNHCHPRPTAAPRPAPEVLHGHVAHLLRRPFPSDARWRGVVLQLRGQGVGHDLPAAPGDEEGRGRSRMGEGSIMVHPSQEKPGKTHGKPTIKCGRFFRISKL